MSNILVVGAGISGATAANLLSNDKSNHITLIDRRGHIAGNCYDYVDESGIRIHKYGSHIFHTDNETVWGYLNQFTRFNNYRHKVLARIGTIDVPLPFNFKSIRMSFPKDKAERLISKLVSEYGGESRISLWDLKENDDPDIEELYRFVYDNIYYGYTKKQWGVGPEEIGSAVVSRVPIHLSENDEYFQDRYQGIPVNGYSEMIDRMISVDNIHTMLGISFKEIDSGKYDFVIYTGSIDELMDYCYGILPYRSISVSLEKYSKGHYQQTAVVNYPSSEKYTRIHEFKYYSDSDSDDTVIGKEYPSNFDCKETSRFYPVSAKENELLYQRYLEEMKRMHPNFFFLGRLGEYKYCNMDETVARTMEVVKGIQGRL